MCICMYVHVVMLMCMQELIGSPAFGILGICELPVMSTGS